MKPIVFFITSLLVFQFTKAEKLKQELKRTSKTGSVVTSTLSKEIYSSRPTQVPYQVEVPYTESESYQVEVPYQMMERYYIDVPYQISENYYEDVAYVESIPYTDYETYYINENICQNVTKYRESCADRQKCELVSKNRRECSDQNICSPKPPVCQNVEECGTNAQGERICKTRNVCKNTSEQDCRTENQCRNIPYTENECRSVRECDRTPYQDRECRYEQVAKQRAVTKYRSETRYKKELRTRTVTRYQKEERSKNVTKYRTETQYRDITKYRTETKCCKTEMKTIFDHNWEQDVEIIFPNENKLLGEDEEQFTLQLKGTEQNPSVEVFFTNSPYKYQASISTSSSKKIVVNLTNQPYLKASDLNQEKINFIGVKSTKGKNYLTIYDKVNVPYIKNQYSLKIIKWVDKSILLEKTMTDLSEAIELTAAYDPKSEYEVQLQVNRSSLTIENQIFSFKFLSTLKEQLLSKEAIKLIKNSELIQIEGIKNINSNPILEFTDLIPSFKGVNSNYQIQFQSIKGSKKTLIGKSDISSLITASATQKISLGSIPILKEKLNKIFISGSQIQIDLIVSRSSSDSSSEFLKKPLTIKKTKIQKL